MLKLALMPRKQNGFGPSSGFGLKKFNPINKGKGVGAAGIYPSQRYYGTSVTRTVIEQYNLDGKWQAWRKGFEIYNLASYSILNVVNPFYDPGLEPDPLNLLTFEYVPAELESVLYQGTGYEFKTLFYGWEFPTANSDVNTHYVAKRDPEFKSLGFVSQVFNNPESYPTQYSNGEVWVKGIPDPVNARLLLQMPGERLTDGDKNSPERTEATIKTVLTEDNKPAIYRGITAPKDVNQEVKEFELPPTQVTVRIPITDINIAEKKAFYKHNQGLSPDRPASRAISLDEILANPEQLEGDLVYIEEFFQEKPVTDLDAAVWGDDIEFAGVALLDSEVGVNVRVFDPGVEQLPPALYDLEELETVFESENGAFVISGTYVFDKSKYQRYFSPTYLTAEIIESEVTDCSYSVLPFTIQKASVEGPFLVLQSVEFQSEIKMYPPLTIGSTLVFSDNSFTKYTLNDDGTCTLDPEVDPWMDEVFTSGNEMRIAPLYTCSCPNHAKAIIASPQSTQSENDRKINRQRQYPLPSAVGLNRFDGAGIDQSAGKITSWEAPSDRLKFKMCKHTIAAMYDEGIRMLEPSTYPTAEAREQFEEKLRKQTRDDYENFKLSFTRSGISLQEIIFALSQGLNLDNIETAYVILNGD